MSYGFREKKGMHRDTNIGSTHIESRQGDWQDRGKENEVEEEGTHQRIMCRKQNERSSNKVEPQRAGGDLVKISDSWIRGNKDGGRWRGNKVVRSQREKRVVRS